VNYRPVIPTEALVSCLGPNKGRLGVRDRSRSKTIAPRNEPISFTFSQFNPVDLALQILEDSSAGKDMGSFRRTKLMLSQALKGSVDSM